MKKKFARAALAAMCTVGMVGVTDLSAQAFGGVCNAERQKDSQFGPDEYRARAECDRLDRDSKARGILVRSNQFDEHTSWFTTLNKWYYTPWDDCPWGCYATYGFGQV